MKVIGGEVPLSLEQPKLRNTVVPAPQYKPSGCPPGGYIITELGVKGVAQFFKKWSPMCPEENMMASNNKRCCVGGEVAQMRVS